MIADAISTIYCNVVNAALVQLTSGPSEGTLTPVLYNVWNYFVRTHSNTVNDLLRRPSVIIETKTQLYIVCWYVRVRWHQSLT